jgi:hypothetical protein
MHFGTDELVQIKLAMMDRREAMSKRAIPKWYEPENQDFVNSLQSTIDCISKELEARG